MPVNSLNKPKKLKPGNTIGIIAPAGVIKDESQLSNVENYFKNKNYKVKFGYNIKKKKYYLAGNDLERLSDLENFFKDDSIDAILCARGGYGTYRLLDKINYEVIKSNPKIFIGYSDISALHSAFSKKSNLITFHGPLALSDFGTKNIDSYTENNFFNILEGKIKSPYYFDNSEDYTCIYDGTVSGNLFASNLAVLCGLMGTPYFPDLKDKILILEDIAEPLYKIDRMLTQLKLGGVFKDIKAVLFSNFTDIPDFDFNQSLIELLKEVFYNLNIPVGLGFPASHKTTKATLPLSVKYNLNASSGILTLIESYLCDK